MLSSEVVDLMMRGCGGPPLDSQRYPDTRRGLIGAAARVLLSLVVLWPARALAAALRLELQASSRPDTRAALRPTGH
jgi:hypothetical protein